jgi:hypothetical protein
MQIKQNRTIILPILYRCETWSLTLREEHRLRVFENKVLKIAFGGGRGGRNSMLQCIIRNFTTVLFTNYQGNQIKEDEKDETCSMSGRDEKCTRNFHWKM